MVGEEEGSVRGVKVVIAEYLQDAGGEKGSVGKKERKKNASGDNDYEINDPDEVDKEHRMRHKYR